MSAEKKPATLKDLLSNHGIILLDKKIYDGRWDDIRKGTLDDELVAVKIPRIRGHADFLVDLEFLPECVDPQRPSTTEINAKRYREMLRIMRNFRNECGIHTGLEDILGDMIVPLLKHNLDIDNKPLFLATKYLGEDVNLFEAAVNEGINFVDRFKYALNLVKIVEAVHKQGVILGDISLTNFLRNGKKPFGISILDFYTSSWPDRNIVHDAPEKIYHGNIAYGARELIRDGKHTIQTDMFATAVAVYMLLTAAHPFGITEKTREYTVGLIMERGVYLGLQLEPSPKNPELVKKLNSIFRRGLSVIPEQRYPSATEMLSDLTDAFKTYFEPFKRNAAHGLGSYTMI
jgi:serine/threonine protein kinase